MVAIRHFRGSGTPPDITLSPGGMVDQEDLFHYATKTGQSRKTKIEIGSGWGSLRGLSALPAPSSLRSTQPLAARPCTSSGTAAQETRAASRINELQSFRRKRHF